MPTIDISTEKQSEVSPAAVDDADLFDPDVTIDTPPPLRSGTIRVRLVYAEPGQPLGTTDPRESEDLRHDG